MFLSSFQNVGGNGTRNLVARVQADLKDLHTKAFCYRLSEMAYPSLQELYEYPHPDMRQYPELEEWDPSYRIPIVDPFARDSEKDRSYGYWVYPESQEFDCRLLIWSRGPDRDFDVSFDELNRMKKQKQDILDVVDYVTLRSYDPTNGSASDGDIVRGSFYHPQPKDLSF